MTTHHQPEILSTEMPKHPPIAAAEFIIETISDRNQAADIQAQQHGVDDWTAYANSVRELPDSL